MYYPYETRLYSHLLPTASQFYLARQNRILNKQVNILLNENRRLRTQILTKDYIDISRNNDRQISYAMKNRSKQIATSRNNNDRNIAMRPVKTSIKNDQYLSPHRYCQSASNRKYVSQGKKKTNNQPQRHQSLNKYYYEAAHRPDVGKQRTIIEDLQSENIQSNPQNIKYITTEKNDKYNKGPYTIQEQVQNESLNNNQYKHKDYTAKKSNQIYMSNYQSKESPGYKLSRLSRYEDSSSRKSKKQYLTIFSNAYEKIQNEIASQKKQIIEDKKQK